MTGTKALSGHHDVLLGVVSAARPGARRGAARAAHAVRLDRRRVRRLARPPLAGHARAAARARDRERRGGRGRAARRARRAGGARFPRGRRCLGGPARELHLGPPRARSRSSPPATLITEATPSVASTDRRAPGSPGHPRGRRASSASPLASRTPPTSWPPWSGRLTRRAVSPDTRRRARPCRRALHRWGRRAAEGQAAARRCCRGPRVRRSLRGREPLESLWLRAVCRNVRVALCAAGGSFRPLPRCG